MINLHKLQVVLPLVLLTASGVQSALNLSGETELDEGESAGPVPYQGSMNISAFVYRDVDRNGVYDLADRPYCGFPIMLHRPDDDAVERSSNISGFTNFKMSLSNPNYPIRAPGAYRIEAQSGENWLVTSGNGKQDLEISELQGSPGGLIAKHSLEPIGVAPILYIAGELGEDLSEQRLFCLSEKGERREVPVNGRGQYSFPAEAGKWVLEVEVPHAATRQRTVLLEDYPVRLSHWTIAEGYSSDTDIEPIMFDDLTSSDTLYEVPNGYKNLSWRNWISTHQKFYGGCGYINAVTSGEFLLYNSSGHPASIASERPFDFIGVHLGVAWPKAEAGSIIVKAWRGDNLVYRDTFKGLSEGPLYFSAGYREITKVEFSTEFYWQVVLDDVQVK